MTSVYTSSSASEKFNTTRLNYAFIIAL